MPLPPSLKKRRWAAAGYALLAALVLAGLAGAWRLPWLAQDDLALSLWLQEGQGPVANPLMRVVSALGTDGVGVPLVLLVAYRLRGRRREAVAAILSLLATPLNVLLKLVADRPRPADPVAVLTGTVGTSFPSGHAMGSAAMYGTLAALLWSRTGRAWPSSALLLVPFMVGVSRVFLGAHWGSDVAAGWAAGALMVVGIMAWLRSKSAARAEDRSDPETE